MSADSKKQNKKKRIIPKVEQIKRTWVDRFLLMLGLKLAIILEIMSVRNQVFNFLFNLTFFVLNLGALQISKVTSSRRFLVYPTMQREIENCMNA